MPFLPNKNAPELHGQITGALGPVTVIASGTKSDINVAYHMESSRVTSIKSIPSGEKSGTNLLMLRAGHTGKAVFQSCNDVTPGQVCSDGVPKTLIYILH